MVRNLRCTVTIESVLANSKTQNAFLFTVHAIFRHYSLAVEPSSTPRPLVQKKLWEILYLLICSFLPCLSWLLRSRVRKFRRDLWITLYLSCERQALWAYYIMIIISIFDVSCCTYGCAFYHTLYLVAHCRKCGKTLVWSLLLLALSIIALRFAWKFWLDTHCEGVIYHLVEEFRTAGLSCQLQLKLPSHSRGVMACH